MRAKELGKTHEEFEESNNSNKGQEVGCCSHDRAKSYPGLHDWTDEQRDKEQSQKNGSIPDNRANGNNTNTNKGAWSCLPIGIRERFDEHIRDDKQGCSGDGPKNFGKDHSFPA